MDGNVHCQIPRIFCVDETFIYSMDCAFSLTVSTNSQKSFDIAHDSTHFRILL